MPRRGGWQRPGSPSGQASPPATTIGCLGELATARLIERREDGWRLRRG